MSEIKHGEEMSKWKMDTFDKKDENEIINKKFTKDFWNNEINTEKKFAEQLGDWKEKGYSEEKITRLALLKNLREVFLSHGFEESQEPHYQKEDDENSDLVFELDTVNAGVYEIRITSKNPEIIIDLKSDTSSKYRTHAEGNVFKGLSELRGIFNTQLKELGINISPIILFEGESYPSKGFSESPEKPPQLPPSAKRISNEEWENAFAGMSKEVREELRQRYWDLPEIGVKGLRTKYGLINGELIKCDGVITIFETPYGKISLPFNEILDPFSVSYGDRTEKKKKRHYIEEENQKEQVI